MGTGHRREDTDMGEKCDIHGGRSLAACDHGETGAGPMTIEQLAALILDQTQDRLRRAYPNSPQWEWEKVQVRPGKVYTKIDRGPEHNMSGFLMVDNQTGDIYGIKGYGKVHKGHHYGTLATADQWYWGEYGPRKLAASA